MQVDKETLLKVAKLARLKIKGDPEKVSQELSKVLTWMEKLKEVDTEHVEPLVYLSEDPVGAREDKPTGHLSREEALKNAPATDGKYILVPKVIDQD